EAPRDDVIARDVPCSDCPSLGCLPRKYLDGPEARTIVLKSSSRTVAGVANRDLGTESDLGNNDPGVLSLFKWRFMVWLPYNSEVRSALVVASRIRAAPCACFVVRAALAVSFALRLRGTFPAYGTSSAIIDDHRQRTRAEHALSRRATTGRAFNAGRDRRAAVVEADLRVAQGARLPAALAGNAAQHPGNADGHGHQRLSGLRHHRVGGGRGLRDIGLRRADAVLVVDRRCGGRPLLQAPDPDGHPERGGFGGGGAGLPGAD